jgi:signal transduction histidine kinase
MNKSRLYLFAVIAIFCKGLLIAQPHFVYSGYSTGYAGKFLGIYYDKSGQQSFEEVKSHAQFEPGEKDVPNLGFIRGNVWLKVVVENRSSEPQLYLELEAPLIDEAELFFPDSTGSYSSKLLGQVKAFSDRKYKHTTYLYDLAVRPGMTRTFYMRVKSYDQVELPVKIQGVVEVSASVINRNFLFGIYCGTMLIMIFYNLFIFISIKDKSYLYYVFYILAILFTQTTFQGYTFKYIWPFSPHFESLSIHLMSILVGFTSVQFLRNFLNTRVLVPRLDRIFIIAYFFYGIAAVMVFMGYLQISWILILCIVSPLSMFMLFVAIRVMLMGNKTAWFFTVAWSVFLVGVFIFAMKDFNILPHNNITVYTMPVGSAIETILLSLALADKIGILKRESEASQLKALALSRENERIIKEQNIYLEEKITERTAELEASNKSLKEAEAHLVNAEKMASLGQLTAGISHEINNPINFVVSSVKPLKRDVDDILTLLSYYGEIRSAEEFEQKIKDVERLKQKIDLDYVTKEISQLLKGIDEGANRTAEIVKGLKNFSRANEDSVKLVNLHDGLDATLTILNSNIQSSRISIIKNYGDIPLVECSPGKINQVFMNIINNAIHAVTEKHGTGGKGLITISTAVAGQFVEIKIKDNGTGIPEANLQKIYDPFFTTKAVGMGTGLGLSIVYGIIQSHMGDIKVESEIGGGTAFIIRLPLKQN